MTSIKGTAPRSGPRARLVAMLVAFAALIAAVGVAGPASAHSGGKAVVLVRNLVIAPVGTGWEARVTLADLDSGSAIPGADARITTGTAAAVALTEADTAGVYSAKLTKLKPGVTNVKLEVRTAPGGLPVAPFVANWAPTLVAGQESVVISGAASGGGGGSSTGMIIGIAGAVLLVALLYGLFSVRRRSAVPAKAK